MPSATAKKIEIEKPEIENVTPVRQALLIIEHKIRNLEKRKVSFNKFLIEILQKINYGRYALFFFLYKKEPIFAINFLWFYKKLINKKYKHESFCRL